MKIAQGGYSKDIASGLISKDEDCTQLQGAQLQGGEDSCAVPANATGKMKKKRKSQTKFRTSSYCDLMCGCYIHGYICCLGEVAHPCGDKDQKGHDKYCHFCQHVKINMLGCTTAGANKNKSTTNVIIIIAKKKLTDLWQKKCKKIPVVTLTAQAAPTGTDLQT